MGQALLAARPDRRTLAQGKGPQVPYLGVWGSQQPAERLLTTLGEKGDSRGPVSPPRGVPP